MFIGLQQPVTNPHKNQTWRSSQGNSRVITWIGRFGLKYRIRVTHHITLPYCSTHTITSHHTALQLYLILLHHIILWYYTFTLEILLNPCIKYTRRSYKKQSHSPSFPPSCTPPSFSPSAALSSLDVRMLIRQNDNETNASRSNHLSTSPTVPTTGNRAPPYHSGVSAASIP